MFGRIACVFAGVFVAAVFGLIAILALPFGILYYIVRPSKALA